MARYECKRCGFLYDEGAEGKLFHELPANWRCPKCRSKMTNFTECPD